jgi:hypothetical protein
VGPEIDRLTSALAGASLMGRPTQAFASTPWFFIRQEHVELFWEIANRDLEDIFRCIPYSMRTQEDFRKPLD